MRSRFFGVFGRRSAQLCAGGDLVIHHDEVELLLTLFGVDGGQQHTAAELAHHCPEAAEGRSKVSPG